MSGTQTGQPDDLANGVSHVLVGLFGTLVIGAVAVKALGIRKASPAYQVAVGLAMIWLHFEIDMPVAKGLAELGI